MTRVTGRVRIQGSWNRQRRAASQSRAMTGNAAALRFSAPSHMLRVIEADIEILFKAIGKAFARGIAAIYRLVTDRAHRNIRRGELRQMTAGAIFVAREIRPHRIIGAMVTAGACERRMLRTRMQKFRIILIVCL